MGKCLIISGGSFSRGMDTGNADYVIACDRGYENAAKLGIKPDVLIGDFDSYTGALPEDIPVLTLPMEKDDTDTLHAIKYALNRGFKRIVLTCALGGRLDHSIANIQSCLYALDNGADISISEADTGILFLRNGSLKLPQAKGWALSLFAIGGPCMGVTERGVKYPLEKARLDCGFPLGVSNEWAADTAEISVDEGTLMIITAKK